MIPCSPSKGDDGAAPVGSPLSANGSCVAPGQKPFLLSFVVEDLDDMLARARAAGVAVEDDVLDEDNGRFGWRMGPDRPDPEGNRIERW